MPYVMVYTPNFPPQRVVLREPVIVGRGAGCEIWIEDQLISRNHCRFEPRGDEWVILDMESRNGVFVDGERVNECVLADLTSVFVGFSEIVFHADRVSERPADPLGGNEPAGSILDRESASENSTILGQTLNSDSAKPRSIDEDRAVSLPFKRQPPTPIVYEDHFND